MADKMFDNSEFYWKRFNCDCLDPRHIVDLSVELVDDGKRVLSVGFAERYIGSNFSLGLRIKRAFQFLLGKEIWGHGFMVRTEDIEEMIDVLENARGKEEL